MLENRLNPDDVYQLLKLRSDEWVEIGRELKLPTSFCNGLDRKGPVYSDNTKLDKVINEWLETWCSPPTWDNLIKALERLKWKSVAEDVKKFLTTDPGAIRKYNWKPGMYITACLYHAGLFLYNVMMLPLMIHDY